MADQPSSCTGSGNLRSSPRLILPPIISIERDRLFLQELTTYIDTELFKIDSSMPDERYIIHKAAFDKVIEHVTSYKPLLTAIKAEYEECIYTITQGKQEATYLNAKLQVIATEASTMRNYKKRCDELMDRMNIVRGNNELLQDELNEIRASKNPVTITWTPSRNASVPAAASDPKRDNRQIPGLTVEESTDQQVLEECLRKVQKQLVERHVSRHVLFQPKATNDILKQKLSDKESMKDNIVKDEEVLKRRIVKIKIATEAAKLYNQFAGPFTQESLGDVIISALRRFRKGCSAEEAVQMSKRLPKDGSSPEDGLSTSPGFEDDDPEKEREAEDIIEYIHCFNELFDSQQYGAAAVHAANSPQQILRTIKTMQKFKGASPVRPDDPSPLLQFCTAVMTSVRALNILPSQEMATVCVECALMNDKINLLAHWVGQQLFNPSEKLGDMIVAYCQCPSICSCKCQAMAQNLYTLCETHAKTLNCMLKQGCVRQAFHYGEMNGCLDEKTSLKLLRTHPGYELARLLVLPAEYGKLTLGASLKALIDGEEGRAVCLLLEEIADDYGLEKINAEIDNPVLSEQDWRAIVNICQQNGFTDLSVQLMAASVVRNAVKMASSLIRGSNT